jgi:hypothetical protein
VKPKLGERESLIGRGRELEEALCSRRWLPSRPRGQLLRYAVVLVFLRRSNIGEALATAFEKPLDVATSPTSPKGAL